MADSYEGADWRGSRLTHSQSQSQTHAHRIRTMLQDLPEGASDAELTRRLSMRHQVVNAVCRKLAAQGLITRERHGGTLINRILPGEDKISFPVSPLSPATPPRSWFWEGNVQEEIVNLLRHNGWTITSQANTARRERGKDIIAERDSILLWVTVKGFPENNGRTPQNLQAGHWFAGALFDVIRWRQEDPTASIAVALPLFQKYQSLRESTLWLEQAAPFGYLWVTEEGAVLSDFAWILESSR
jgi:hypothetical protein